MFHARLEELMNNIATMAPLLPVPTSDDAAGDGIGTMNAKEYAEQITFISWTSFRAVTVRVALCIIKPALSVNRVLSRSLKFVAL